MGEATKYSIWVDNIVGLGTQEYREKQEKTMQNLFGKNITGKFVILGLQVAPNSPDLADRIIKALNIDEQYFSAKVEKVEANDRFKDFIIWYMLKNENKICSEAMHRLKFIEESRLEHYTNFSSLGDCLKLILAERVATVFRGKDYSIKIATTG